MLKAFADGLIFGESFGDGPARVIWLHGWGRSGQDFRTAGERLAARGIASTAFDLPGFGASPAPVAATGARGYDELIAPAIREATLGHPYVVVGHSFGGRIASVLAATPESNVLGVVFAGAPLVPRSIVPRRPSRRYRALRRAASWGLVSQERMDRARQRYGSADYRNATGVMRDVLVATVNESYESELAHISAPAIFVWGELDTDVPVAVAQRAAALVRGTSSVREFAGRGHLVPLDNPDALVQAAEELSR